MANDSKEQTKRFALDVIRFCPALPNKADFINKLSIVEVQADDSEHWLELVGDLSSAHCTELARLKNEASQRGANMVQLKETARTADSKFEIRNSLFP